MSRVMGAKSPLMVWCCFCLLACAATADPPGTVRVAIDRKVGYVIGDLIPYDVFVTTDASWTLRKSSLPGPGRMEYWLELRRVDTEHRRMARSRVYRVHLVYQVFYAPLEARRRTLPGFLLEFDRPDGPALIKVPQVFVTLSPLRELANGAGDPEANVALQPDRSAPAVPLGRPLAWLAISSFTALSTLLVMAWQRAIGPFARRPGAPFARAERVLRRLGLNDPQAYATGLLTLHRAFDQAAGWHVFADDLQRFLSQLPHFSAEHEQIAQFFAASRLRFFGDSPQQSATRMPAPELSRLAKRLAELERRS